MTHRKLDGLPINSMVDLSSSRTVRHDQRVPSGNQLHGWKIAIVRCFFPRKKRRFQQHGWGFNLRWHPKMDGLS